MLNAHRIAALLLLACWLPAILHCRLEAAGLLDATQCCSSDGPIPAAADSHGCDDDSCDVVEGAFLAPVAETVQGPSVTLAFQEVWTMAAIVVAAPAETVGVVESTAAPPEATRPPAIVVPGLRQPRAP